MATVLVVDDVATNRKLLVALLRHMGHAPLEAADGAHALALAQASPPDLIISDILMPTMDGYEFVRQLRADAALAHTPVIFYTAHYHEHAARQLALACGVSRVLGKPSPRGVIVAAIEGALQDRPPAATPVPEADADFGRDHVRLMTDKLSDKVAELQYANHRLAALTDLNLQFASERDPHRMLDKVARGARELIGASYAVLCVRETGPGRDIFFTTGGLDHDRGARTAPAVDRGLLGAVASECRSRRIQGMAGVREDLGLPASYPPIRSALAAPVASLTHVYGWICLADKLGAESFDDDDERILAILGAQAGRIYQNGSLYAEMKRNADRLEVEVAQRNSAVESLSESELRFRQLAENIREVFWLTDPGRNEVLYISPAYEQVWGRKVAALLASPREWTDAIHPEDRDRVIRASLEQASGKYAEQYRVVRPDGSIRWIYDKAFPVADDSGKVVRIAGIAEDVTERVRLVQALLEREAALQRAQQLAKLAHVVSRRDGTFESWSEALPQLLGLGAERVPRSVREWLELVHPDDRARYRALALATAARGTGAEIEYRLRHAQDGWIHVSQTVEPLPGDPGGDDAMRWFSTMQDVSAQKEVEEDLRVSDREVRHLNADLERRVAESTSELRATISELQAFSHSVAHDLRAPLRSIMGMSNILIEQHGGQLSDEGTRLLERVGAAGLRMNRIIAGLLELSLIGRAPIRRMAVDLSADARAIARQLEESAPQRHVAFTIEGDIVAQADADMAEVVLENLLRNAWKFTARQPAARIAFGAAHADGETVYFVRDNGAGFDMKHADKLFTPFARVHSISEFEGEGIGLATVRRIVERHGGRAWIDSQAGTGTTVRFTLAAPAPALAA